jgi:hypothetical protein
MLSPLGQTLLITLYLASQSLAALTCQPYSIDTTFPGGKYDDLFYTEDLATNVLAGMGDGQGGDGISTKLSTPGGTLNVAAISR